MAEAVYTINLARTANQPVSEGIHPFLITDIVEGESSSGNPMWTVRLQCLSEGADAGKEATLWLVLIDSMRWKVEKFLDAVGAPETGEATYVKFFGRKFKAQVSHRKQDGRTLADIGEMFPMSSSKGTNPTPVSAAKVKEAKASPVTRTGAAAQAKVPAKAGKALPDDVSEEEINV